MVDCVKVILMMLVLDYIILKQACAKVVSFQITYFYPVSSSFSFGSNLLFCTLIYIIEIIMGSTASTLSTDILKNLMKNMSTDMKDALALEIIKKCADILKENPGNRCCKYTIEYLSSDAGKALSNEGL